LTCAVTIATLGQMFGSSRTYAVVGLVASLLGLLFASNSTLDYASHLDRRLHDVHCSFIPGAPPTSEAEACRAAMYSPYSALFKEAYWGGIPISLFAMGAFTFFAGFSLYLLLAGSRAPRAAVTFFGAVSFTPFLVSVLMLVISLTKLGQVCKTCTGIYLASTLLLVAGMMGLASLRGDLVTGAERPRAGFALPLAWLLALGITTLVPAVVYAASVPDHRKFLAQCGEIKLSEPKAGELVSMRGARPVQPALLFEDPLCPTCKAFHERLVGEGAIERLDARLALFPLDSECNWMLNEPLHPGACLLSKAVLCGGEQASKVLEWAYEKQEELARAGKSGPNALKALIRQRWGESVLRCMDDRKTEVRLNNHLHFASDNGIPVSTPQVYFGKKRICDEDTDIGLRYTLAQLAPEVLK
jgi:uncharacterized membrane protein